MRACRGIQALILVTLAALPGISNAATYTVTALDDAGPGTLREALETANAFPGTDVIEVDPLLAGGEVLLSSPLLVTDSVTVSGSIAVSGQSMVRVLEIDDGLPGSSISVVLNGLRLHSGALEAAVAQGGLVYNAEVLRIENATLENATLRGTGDPAGDWLRGGCIYSGPGSELQIDSSTISGCQLVMQSDVAHDARGAGIYAAGTLTVVNSTLTSNSIVSVTSSYSDTVAGTALGGAIYVADGATWSVTHSTLAFNGVLASDSGNEVAGLYVAPSASGLLSHAIVTDNALFPTFNDYIAYYYFADATAGVLRDLGADSGAVVAYSIVSSPVAVVTDGVGGNQIVARDAVLALPAVLADNGGPTRTLMIRADGPAVNTGNAGLAAGVDGAPLFDQRGADFPRVIGVVDIGALERAQYSTVPVAVNDDASTLVREAIQVDVLSNDSVPEGAAPGPVQIVRQPSWGTAQALDDGRVLYTPVYPALTNYFAVNGELPVDVVGYRVTDLLGQVSGEGRLSVSFVNQPPQLQSPLDAVYSGERGQMLEINLAGHMFDPDGATISYVLGGASGTGLSVQGQLIRGVLGSVGTYNLTVTGSDGLSTGASTFQLQILPSSQPNQAPQPVAGMPSVNSVVGATLDLDLAQYFLDPDGDLLTFTLVSDATGDLSLIDGRLVGSFSATCACDVVVRVSDGIDTIDATVPVVVAAAGNVSPQVREQLGFVVVPLGYVVNLDLNDFFYDPNGDTLTYELEGLAASGLQFDGSHTISGTLGIPGIFSVVARASDGAASTPLQVYFEVTGSTNDAPVVTSSIESRSVSLGTGIDIDVSAHFLDPDGDTLTYTVEGLDGSGLTYALGRITGVVSGRGIFRAVVTASDGVASASQVFALYVDNRSPQASVSLLSRTLRQGEAFSLDVAPFFSDADGDALVYSLLAPVPPGYSVTPAGLVSAGAVEAGVATVIVQASDGLGGTAQVTLELEVLANSPPEFLMLMPVEYLYQQGDIVDLDFRPFVVDPDGDELVVGVSGLGTSGLQTSAGTLSGTALLPGRYVMVVRAEDPFGAYAERQIIVTVAGNVPPELIDNIPDLTVEEGDVITIALLNYFYDPSGTLDFTIDGLLASQYNLAGSSLTITIGTAGLYPVTVTGTDGFNSVPDQFSITVEAVPPPVNQPPALLSMLPALQAASGVTRTVNLGAYFSDPEGQPVTYSLQSASAGAVASVSGSTLTVRADAPGNYDIMVRASDSQGAGTDAVATLTVATPASGPALKSGPVGPGWLLGLTALLLVRQRYRRPAGTGR